MKRLFMILLLVLPLTVTAADVKVCAMWNAHPDAAAATIRLDYSVNSVGKGRFGKVSGDRTIMCKTIALNRGDKICGHIWATVNGVSSGQANEACNIYNPDVPKPEGLGFGFGFGAK